MSILLVIIHVFVCIALIMIVLFQTGKGADMGAAFGGGASQTLFGSTGASTFLSKATYIAAIVFMLTSLCLAYLSSHKTERSMMMETKTPVNQQMAIPSDTDAGTLPEQKPAESQKSDQTTKSQQD